MDDNVECHISFSRLQQGRLAAAYYRQFVHSCVDKVNPL